MAVRSIGYYETANSSWSVARTSNSAPRSRCYEIRKLSAVEVRQLGMNFYESGRNDKFHPIVNSPSYSSSNLQFNSSEDTIPPLIFEIRRIVRSSADPIL